MVRSKQGGPASRAAAPAFFRGDQRNTSGPKTGGVMLSIQKILVPVVFVDTFRHVVHQAAWLARRFHLGDDPVARGNASQLSGRLA